MLYESTSFWYSSRSSWLRKVRKAILYVSDWSMSPWGLSRAMLDREVRRRLRLWVYSSMSCQPLTAMSGLMSNVGMAFVSEKGAKMKPEHSSPSCGRSASPSSWSTRCGSLSLGKRYNAKSCPLSIRRRTMSCFCMDCCVFLNVLCVSRIMGEIFGYAYKITFFLGF